MLSYHTAQLSDLPFIIDVYNSTVASRMVTADTQPVTVESRLGWFAQHHPQTRPLWLLKWHDKACGWVSLSSFYGRPAFNKTAEISLYLHTDFRGQKLGIPILEYVESVCPALGIETIMSFIFGHNHPSIKLFKQAGYAQWGFLPTIAELDETKRDLVILGKKIVANLA
ncbi:N-acetyltransferase family protein [Utexia brackfieldae]|uniref:GNAT family N-acetyltransferase n=1 Tax=Utexia brackfieldae TaxID=3074108 RepID=UPI00370DE0D7